MLRGLINTGRAQPMSRYVFIDGAALLRFVSDATKRVPLEAEPSMNYGTFLTRLNALRGFFYDAYPSRRENQTEDDFQDQFHQKDVFLRRLSRVDRMHVRTGVSRHRKGRGLEQKGVDIQLAIDAYQHAVLGNMEEAVLVTNDLDFLPLLDALTQTRVRTELRYVIGKTSDDLLEAADRAVPLTLSEFLEWCDLPYSRYGRWSWHNGFNPTDFSEVIHGNLGSRKLIVYQIEGDERYFLKYEDEDRHLSCFYPNVGIEVFEIEAGERFEQGGARHSGR